jgi:predicted amidohydrolase YtcJ
VRGAVTTGDPRVPSAEAVAIDDGRVVAVGTWADVRTLVGAKTETIDLGTNTITPGLVDAHAHLVGLGVSLAIVDLRGATSIDDVIARLKQSAPPTGWVLGRGWDQNLWPDKAMPTEAPLTAAFPDRPVWLRRVDGHAGWGNRALLHAAGIDAQTSAPQGGEILKDAGGNPTGVLVDAAMDRVPVPPKSRAELREAILAGQQQVLACGLTGVHEMGIDENDDALYRELAQSGELRLRITAYATASWLDTGLLERRPDPIAEHQLYALRGVKLYADGALGSRGAALLADYADRPGYRGLMQLTTEALDDACRKCVAGGWQIATHAIGDAANRAVLDAYAKVQRELAGTDRRLRIEHCQIVDVADIPRFAELGVVASMQPTHATSDMGWVPDRIGAARLPGAYAWRRFLDAKVALAFGSDFPVERTDVTHGLYAAVTRQAQDGTPAGGWLPDQRLSLGEAIDAFTRAAAHACHREAHLGVLRPGMRADLTCFGGVLDEANPSTIANATIAATIVDGVVAHRA